jgi:transposase
MTFVPAPHPPEFRRRAVELARLGEQPIAQVAKDLGISESCLRNWMAQTDSDDGKSSTSRLSSDERAELAELRKKTRRLETENEIFKRAAAYFRAGERPPKVIYPLVRELADDFDVAVTCRVLQVSRSGYYESAPGSSLPGRRRTSCWPRRSRRFHDESRRHLRLAAGARRIDPRARAE